MTNRERAEQLIHKVAESSRPAIDVIEEAFAEALDASSAQGEGGEQVKAQQLIRRILQEYSDEMTKEACDNCEQCGQLVMCSFHSVLSLLSGETRLQGAEARETP